jgi:hypothetical protein
MASGPEDWILDIAALYRQTFGVMPTFSRLDNPYDNPPPGVARPRAEQGLCVDARVTIYPIRAREQDRFAEFLVVSEDAANTPWRASEGFRTFRGAATTLIQRLVMIKLRKEAP